MDFREKLVEICFHEFCMVAGDSPCGCDGCPYGKYGSENNECFEAYKKQKFEELEKAGVTVQEWKPISEPPKETGHYLVNIHQENDESGEEANFVLDAWYEVNGLLFVPKTAGWTLLNEWYDLTAQMLPFVTHWTERPQPPKGE